MRSKAPERAETGAMPGNNGVGFDYDESISPSGPKPAKQDLKQSIAGLELRARMFSIQHTQLLAKRKNFDTKIASRVEERTEK
jgi:hypothetical protein